jgi:hypothetical protein
MTTSISVVTRFRLYGLLEVNKYYYYYYCLELCSVTVVKITVLKLHLKMYKLEGQMLKQVAVIPINYVQLFKA